MKNPVRNEHREAYKAGKFDEVPQHVLALIKEQEKQNEESKEAEQEIAGEETSKKVKK